MLQPTVHYGLHFGLPLFIALVFFKKYWLKAYGIMILGMLIDLDHLLANPIFAPNRCSINFHVLHSYYAIIIYLILFYFKKFRILSVGLLFHMVTDFIDCLLMK